MSIRAGRESIRITALIAILLLMPGVMLPAHASCFINSWCSNSYSKEYNTSSCSYQRQSCDNSSSSSSSPAPRLSCGAIAYSPDSGAWGYSEEYGSRAQAESRARKECRSNDCEIAAWFYNSCGAGSASDNGSWGGAQGDNEQRAQHGAQARCAKEGGTNCKVVVSRCSR